MTEHPFSDFAEWWDDMPWNKCARLEARVKKLETAIAEIRNAIQHKRFKDAELLCKQVLKEGK